MHARASCRCSSLAAVTSTSRVASAISTRAAGPSDRTVSRRHKPSITAVGKVSRHNASDITTRLLWISIPGLSLARLRRLAAGVERRSAFRSEDTVRWRQVYLAAAPASTLSWVPVTYRPLSDTRKMTASLMSSGSAHAIGKALIPLNASATSAGTFSAP